MADERPKANWAGRLKRGLWPRRWRWALVRLAAVAILIVLFRLHVLTWLVAGHNVAWRLLTGATGNNAGDVDLLLRLGEPGARMLVRIGEAQALMRSVDPAALPVLLDLARSSADSRVRANAVVALSGFADGRVLPAAAKALDDPEPAVRRAGLTCIRLLGDARHRPLIEARLKAETDPGLKKLLAEAAGALLPAPGPPEARAGEPTVRVAAIQFASEFGKPEANRGRLEALVRDAARDGAKIVVLPETAIQGYLTFDIGTAWQADGLKVTDGLRGVSPKDVAESVPGPSTEAFARLAGELGVYVSVPVLEVDKASGRYYNSVCLVGPEGKLLLHYRKLNPWPYAERGWAAVGDRGRPVLDTPYGRLALLICYDIHTEPAHLKEAGVDVLLYSIAWVDRPKSTWFQAELPRIARESNLHIVGANWTVPREPAWHGYGQSLIIERTGRVLARARRDVGEEIIHADPPVRRAPGPQPGPPKPR
jgi:predicted amidohydrolase